MRSQPGPSLMPRNLEVLGKCRAVSEALLRIVTASMAPRVDYELTELDRSLIAPVNTLAARVRKNRRTIEAARRHFDANGKRPLA